MTVPRIAICQLDYNPAWSELGHYALREPDLLSDYSLPLADLLLDCNDEQRDLIRQWQAKLQKYHEESALLKLQYVLPKLSEHVPTAVVLPEYSVPCSLLPRLAHLWPKNAIIVAGTHTVRRDCTDGCIAAGFPVKIKTDVSKAIAPVILPGGRLVVVEKLESSSVEGTSLEPGDPTKERSFTHPEFPSYVFKVHICIEAHPSSKSFPRHFTDDPERRTIHLVTALTPHVKEFSDSFGEKTSRSLTGTVVAFANRSDGGGSQVFYHGSDHQTILQNRQGSLPGGKHEEVITVVELNEDYQRSLSGGSTKVPTVSPTAAQTSAFCPIYYPGHTATDVIVSALRNDDRSIRPARLSPQAALLAKYNYLCSIESLDDLRPSHRHLIDDVLTIPDVARAAELRFACCVATKRYLETTVDTAKARELSAALERWALKVADSAGIGMALQQITAANNQSADDLLTHGMIIAARILDKPSSGSVDTDLASWLRDIAKDRSVTPEVAQSVCDWVAKVRPYPAARFVSRISSNVGEGDWLSSAGVAAEHHLVRKKQQVTDLVRQAIDRQLVSEGGCYALFAYSEAVVAIFQAFAKTVNASSITLLGISGLNHLGFGSGIEQSEQLVDLGYNMIDVPRDAFARVAKSKSPELLFFGSNIVHPGGAIVSVGADAASRAAKAYGAKVVLAATSLKAWGKEEWSSQANIVLDRSRPQSMVVSAKVSASSNVKRMDPAYDDVGRELIDIVVSNCGIWNDDEEWTFESITRAMLDLNNTGK